GRPRLRQIRRGWLGSSWRLGFWYLRRTRLGNARGWIRTVHENSPRQVVRQKRGTPKAGYFLALFFFAGTLPPFLRAFESPIATACLRLVTFFSDLPLLSFPSLNSCMAFLTSFCAFFPYLAMAGAPGMDRGATPANQSQIVRRACGKQQVAPLVPELMPQEGGQRQRKGKSADVRERGQNRTRGEGRIDLATAEDQRNRAPQ